VERGHLPKKQRSRLVGNPNLGISRDRGGEAENRNPNRGPSFMPGKCGVFHKKFSVQDMGTKKGKTGASVYANFLD